jgi:hypothetical protein
MAKSSRTELIRLLTVAAELEHALCCQYLFAAFSLKHDTSEGLTDDQLNRVVDWERMILSVAREEMAHLGIVLNLLTALGGAPEFDHPPFPYPTLLYGHRMALEPFSVATLQKFVCFERPRDIEPADAFCASPPPAAHPSEDFATVEELYDQIRKLLVELDAQPAELFVGPACAQVGGQSLGTDFARLGAMGGGYDIFMLEIFDLASALAAIERVIEDGEGAPEVREVDHYHRFLGILEAVEAADPPFEAARRVVSTPVLDQPIARAPGTVVTEPLARAVMGLFDDAYRVMLMTLTRLFAHTDETEDDLAVLRSVAFFPLMTMAIRPLAEVLTAMPAHAPDDGTRAGPSFDAGGPIAFLPHRAAAWTVLEEELREVADRAAEVAGMPGAPPRVAYIAGSLDLTARRFAAGMGIAAQP